MEINRHLLNIKPSYIREILSAAKSPNMISLAGGLPATELMPIELFMQAMKALDKTPEVFQYGETQGYEPLLEFIEENYHLAKNIESIVCNGSQQGLDLIARAYINPGDIVIMETPSYLGALQVFGLAQANIVSVQQHSNGPDVDELESLFLSKPVKFFYTVPDFHNPTGKCWSLEVRKQVANLCLQYGVTLIEDIPYREMRFSGENLPLVSSWCVNQSMVLRSFSKVSAPGVRLGIVSAKSDLITTMIKVKQAADLHTGLPMQAALLHVFQNPKFQTHIDRIQVHYQERYAVLCNALLGLSEQACSFDTVDGGMFVWLRLPKISAISLANKLIDKGVAVVPSDVFYPSEEIIKPALRLNFSHCSPKNLEKAVSIIKQTLLEML